MIALFWTFHLTVFLKSPCRKHVGWVQLLFTLTLLTFVCCVLGAATLQCFFLFISGLHLTELIDLVMWPLGANGPFFILFSFFVFQISLSSYMEFQGSSRHQAIPTTTPTTLTACGISLYHHSIRTSSWHSQTLIWNAANAPMTWLMSMTVTQIDSY